jgi:hypothetical protein
VCEQGLVAEREDPPQVAGNQWGDEACRQHVELDVVDEQGAATLVNEAMRVNPGTVRPAPLFVHEQVGGLVA